ncbi:hypothetical protein FB451DRAFT_1556067, partial [Mycena latifolia]
MRGSGGRPPRRFIQRSSHPSTAQRWWPLSTHATTPMTGSIAGSQLLLSAVSRSQRPKLGSRPSRTYSLAGRRYASFARSEPERRSIFKSYLSGAVIVRSMPTASFCSSSRLYSLSSSSFMN